jgi:signal transduction histidine kinase
MTSNSDVLWVIIFGTTTFLIILFFLISFILYFQKRKLQNHQETEKLHSQYAQELLVTRIEVQNSTLQYAGRELHDNIGQLLTVARLNLNILEDNPHTAEDQEYIVQTNEIIGQAIADLRILSKSFDGDFVKDFGLVDSLAHELLRLRKTKKFQTEMAVNGEVYSLGYDKEIILFRIAQEVLNNIIKHSSATSITSSINYEPQFLRLSISDNGQGFDFKSINARNLKDSGSGLRNMQRRVELIKGVFSLESSKFGGTRVEIVVSATNYE